uniref:Complement factor H like 3 n=1 Tax=Cyprinus carpio TaxID=7962 RepID=A0A8C2JEX3_CYPCA
LGEDIIYENTEPVANISYTDGETVKVNCMQAHIFFVTKLKFALDRINRRHCRIKGKPNLNQFIYFTEVRCPVIHTDEDVTASGKTYGDVIHFECVSSDKKLDGSSVIYCKENGVWNGPVPQCIVTCQLEVTEPEVIRTIPWGQTVFKAGETVEIICSEKKKQIYNKQETFTCTDIGKWDYKPTCEERRCEAPLNQHVYLPKYYFSGDLNLGVKRSYSCEFGHRKTASEATCTREGWTPKPLCAEEPVQITSVSQGQWTGIRQCTGVLQLDFILLNVDFFNQVNHYMQCTKRTENVKLVLICNYTVICLDKICPPPPYVENGDYIIRDRDGKVITEIYYICQTNYVLNERKKYYKCDHSFPNDFLESLPSCSVLNSVCNQLYFVSVKEPCAITLEILEAHNIKPI